jgi:hypothetical protein
MPHYFPHENLEVYAHAVSFAKFAAALIDSWPTVFAVYDQLNRATESVVTNLETVTVIESHTAKGYLREVLAMLGGLKVYLQRGE